MKKYISTTELATRWGVGREYISALCTSGKIKGAKKNGRLWEIPVDVERPKDNRCTEHSLNKRKGQFTFIDLFAGIGGFHQAMTSLGGRCVMAAEIDSDCVETYNANFKCEEKTIRGDVNDIDPKSIGDFDVLCAGFPCQPFSKAGYQHGFNDKKRGNLFFKIMDILDEHPETKFVILENVRNLADKTQNWEIITNELSRRNFYITDEPIILSPSHFGIPQIRERVYILAIRRDIRDQNILTNGCIHIEDLRLDKFYRQCGRNSAWDVLEDNVPRSYCIPEYEEEAILIWEEFRRNIKTSISGYPVWIKSFGLGITDEEDYKKQQGYYDMPDWKKIYVQKNRNLYLNNKEFIDEWIANNNMLDRIKLHQKFEWNCGEDVYDIREGIIQIRQSGIRVKRPTFFPSLVAIVNTPIIWDADMHHFRYLTEREAANLQNFKKSFKFVGKGKRVYRQLGNAVNVKVVKILSKQLFSLAIPEWREIDE